MGKIISVLNNKGGVGKTSVTVNLGIGLARAGEKVLLVDADPQGSMTVSLGYPEPDAMDTTLSTVMEAVLNDEEILPEFGIIRHEEGVDFLPANIELSGLEVSLVNVMSRETVLKRYVETLRDRYSYILIDCLPSLGMVTVNALVAADSVIIPAQASYLSAKGLQQLIKTVFKVKKQLNRGLEIRGILFTMVDFRTNHAKEISAKVREAYGENIPIFESTIPFSVRAAEASTEGKSIFTYDPKGKLAKAYQELTEEVLCR